jgi:hypothetical protein
VPEKSRLFARRGEEPVLLRRDAAPYPRRTEFSVTPLWYPPAILNKLTKVA